MGFNRNSLSGDTLDRVFHGLQAEPGAVIDALQGVNRVSVTELSGTVPVLPSGSKLARLTDTGLSEGAVAKDFDSEFSSVTYAVKRYLGKTRVPDGTRVALDGYGLQTLETFARRCRDIANAKINAKLDTTLKDTSLNKEEAAGNAWTDKGASSTPIEDIQDAMAKCGYGDTMILGRDVVEALMIHDEFINRAANFSSGGVGMSTVASILFELFPQLRQVYTYGFMNLYNSATEGQSAVLAYEFDGLAWVGHARDLVFVEQQGTQQSAMWRDEDAESSAMRYTRRIDIIRPNQDTGCVITGVI